MSKYAYEMFFGLSVVLIVTLTFLSLSVDYVTNIEKFNENLQNNFIGHVVLFILFVLSGNLILKNSNLNSFEEVVAINYGVSVFANVFLMQHSLLNSCEAIFAIIFSGIIILIISKFFGFLLGFFNKK